MSSCLPNEAALYNKVMYVYSGH